MPENQSSGYESSLIILNNSLEKITDPERKKRLEIIIANLKETIEKTKSEEASK